MRIVSRGILLINLIVINKIKVNNIKVMADKSENLKGVINHDPLLSTVLGLRNDKKFKTTPTKMLEIKTLGIKNLIYNFLIILSL
ncbi:MAG: hypothetical protein ACFE94_00655 [Candidatus Hodarchaeota archaeon]